MEKQAKFWYSSKQKDVIQATGGYYRNYAKLDNGEIVEYTEMKSGESINSNSLWDDAEYLGIGEFYQHEEIDEQKVSHSLTLPGNKDIKE